MRKGSQLVLCKHFTLPNFRNRIRKIADQFFIQEYINDSSQFFILQFFGVFIVETCQLIINFIALKIGR